ncbi:hypothetical protein ACQX4N_06160, partial [Corynebacterium diphtheriae]
FPASPLMVSVGWGSVLKNPDRLRLAGDMEWITLGFSSQKPDRLQVAKKSCLTWFFGLPEV